MSDSPIIKSTVKGIASTSLFKEVNTTLREAIDSFGVKWNNPASRDAFIEVIEDWFEEQIEKTGRIAQFKVCCDERNNNFSAPSTSINVDVYYRQMHCLNQTHLHFLVKK